MSEFWAYPYADVLAICLIGGLGVLCLVQARCWAKNL